MSTCALEDQLAEIRRRIDRLEALAQVDAAAERPRIRRHVDALHQAVAVAMLVADHAFVARCGEVGGDEAEHCNRTADTAAFDRGAAKGARTRTTISVQLCSHRRSVA